MTLAEAKAIVQSALDGAEPEGADPLSEILMAIIVAVESLNP